MAASCQSYGSPALKQNLAVSSISDSIIHKNSHHIVLNETLNDSETTNSTEPTVFFLNTSLQSEFFPIRVSAPCWPLENIQIQSTSASGTKLHSSFKHNNFTKTKPEIAKKPKKTSAIL